MKIEMNPSDLAIVFRGDGTMMLATGESEVRDDHGTIERARSLIYQGLASGNEVRARAMTVAATAFGMITNPDMYDLMTVRMNDLSEQGRILSQHAHPKRLN